MINEARTLLLNVSGIDNDMSTPWSEFVPTEYVAVPLPPWLATVRRLLFGVSPTRQTLNIRTRQYMQLLHAGIYEDHVIDLDSRITYLPFVHTELPDVEDLPPQNVGEIFTQLKQTVHSEHEIFRGGQDEPYKTCRNLWLQHQLGTYQLTGLLLAVIYCTRDVRSGLIHV